MDTNRADRLSGLTRRSWLSLAAAGLGLGPRALAAACAQDEKKTPRKGQIIAYARRLHGDEKLTGLIGIDPDDGTWQLLISVDRATNARLSPDGKTLAYVEPAFRKPGGVSICGLQGDEPPRRIAESGGSVNWSPDGKQLVVSATKLTPDGKRESGRFETLRMNPDGSHQTPLPLAKDQSVMDWSRDARWFLTFTLALGGPWKVSPALIHPDGTGLQPFYDGPDWIDMARFSPDSREIVYTLAERTPTNDGRPIVRGFSLWAAHIDGTGRRQLPVEDTISARPCWSPDGKRLALGISNYKKKVNGDLTPLRKGGRIAIVDADGKNRRDLPLPEGDLVLLDWR